MPRSTTTTTTTTTTTPINAPAADEYKCYKFHSSVKAMKVPVFKSKTCKDCNCDDETCRNGSSRIECPPNCRDCSNQLFRRPETHVKVTVKDCGKKGRGMFACQPIKADSFVIPFKAEVISEDEKTKRSATYKKLEQHAYFFGSGVYTLDASKFGNEAKFTNHCCLLNMRVEQWSIHGAPSDFKALGFFAERDIEEGEELTISYGEEYSKTMKCYCGAPNCAGIVGQKPLPMKKAPKGPIKKSAPPVANPKPAEKKVARKPPTQRTAPEDIPKTAPGRVLRKRPAAIPVPEVSQRPKRTRKTVF